jgi:hypothetical protein
MTLTNNNLKFGKLCATYNLGLEGPDAAERGLGTSQVLHTLQALNDYAGFIPVCLEWLADND